MNKIVYIFFLSILVFSCTSNTIIKKPDDLIPKDQMVDLLTDLLLANGGKNIKNINLERDVNYFPVVFEKYKIDTTQFKKSNFYYTSRIDDYDEILKKVENRLKELKKIYDKERAVLDSIRKDSLMQVREKLNRDKILK